MPKIKDLPKVERPREKLIAKGSENLKDEELLAVLLGTGTKGKYKWGEDVASQHMKKFYNDILHFIEIIDKKHNKISIIIFIHGMKNYKTLDNKYKMGIDIGCGLKYDKGLLKTAREHPGSGTNRGVRRAKRKNVKKLCEVFNKELKRYGLKSTIGERFVAWSKSNGVQFVKSPDCSFQLEIAKRLRGGRNKRETERILNNTAKIISGAIKQVYS